MEDVIYTLAAITFFTVALGYALACERGRGDRKDGV